MRTIDLALAPTSRRVSIQTDDERIERYVHSVYGRLVTTGTCTDADRAVLCTASRPARATFRDEPLPGPDPADPDRPWNSGAYVTDQFVWRALARDDAWLALHASALSIADRGVLLVGPSGCGKTTLSLALAAAGAGLYGDEMALLHRATRTMAALPRRIAVREHSLEVLRDAALAAAVRRGESRGSVHYVDVKELFPNAPPDVAQPVRALFIIDGAHREDPPRIAPLSRAAAAMRLAPYLGYGRRTLDEVAALAQVLADATAFTLFASDPYAATELVIRTASRC